MRVIRADHLLFVGDPHLSSRKPGRRVEQEWEFIDVCCDKLSQAIEKANALNAVCVILGDLFDKNRDSYPLLMTKLFKILRSAKHPIFCMPGNHDLLATEVTEDTAYAAVVATGLLESLDQPGVVNVVIEIQGKKIALVPFWHGQDLPKDVSHLRESYDHVVAITHHDIAFEGAYPGSLEPHEIVGCDLLVNGHMHRTTPSVVKGQTRWCNPGNILRQTLADAKHTPSVWAWAPDFQDLVQHRLRFVEHVFDWTGKNKSQSMPDSLTPFAKDLETDSSTFVTRLQATLSTDLPKSSQADILKEDLDAIKTEQGYNDDVCTILDRLHQQVVSEQARFQPVVPTGNSD